MEEGKKGRWRKEKGEIKKGERRMEKGKFGTRRIGPACSAIALSSPRPFVPFLPHPSPPFVPSPSPLSSPPPNLISE
jgi:hypothetical protein